MFVCFTNNKDRSSDMYDKLIELTNISDEPIFIEN